MAGSPVPGSDSRATDAVRNANEATTTPVSASDLDDLEDVDVAARRAAESLRRRTADLELRDELARIGFTGPGWRRFAEELARYGYAVMMAWLATGEIFNQCRKKNCYPGDPPAHWTRDDRIGLADDTVGAAVAVFRERALIGRGWDHTAGASLKTYFIGACVYQFPNQFRRWATDNERWSRIRRLEPGAEELVQMLHNDAEDLALTRPVSQEAFNAIPDDRTRTAMLMQSLGYTTPEIAELLADGTTVKAVEMLLRRHRRRVSPPQNRRASS